MAKNVNWWMIIGVTIVVAIIVSLVTVSLTGSAIMSGGDNFYGPSVFQSSNFLQAVFQGTMNAGGIGLKSFDGYQFELQSVPGGTFIIYDRNANQYRMVIDRAGNVNIGTGTISSANPLKFSSSAGVTKLESDLTLTKIGQAGGTQFITNDAGALTIIPQAGATKLFGTLTLSGNNYQGGVVLKSNEAGALTIIPQAGAAKIEGYLSITNLTGFGNAYACVDSGGRLYRSLTACR